MGLFATNPQSEPEPEPAPQPHLYSAAKLRPYQDAAVKSVLQTFKAGGRSTLVVSATGTGKTIIMADLARRAVAWGHGVLWLCHRAELMEQGQKALGRMGVPSAIEKAEASARGAFEAGLVRTVVASTPTLRGQRLEDWPEDAFRLVISDEAHHVATATKWAEIPRRFRHARHVGFTATADRLDGKNIGCTFDSLAFEYNLRDAIRDGWLVPVEAFPVTTKPQIDLSQLRLVAGDFRSEDLEEVIQANIGTLVNALVQTNALQDRRTIAFTPNVASAEALALALEDVGIKARHIHGGMGPDERRRLIEGHKAGVYQVLCNCMVLTEGYDDPATSCILMCSPTKSRSLYSQMVGRGTRCYPGPADNEKPNCRIVDFAYLTGKHELVCPVDLYDTQEMPDAVVKRAKELLEPEKSLDQALEEAQREFDASERVRIQRRMVQARAVSFDPLGAGDVLGLNMGKAGYADFMDTRPATPKMVETLRKFKLNIPDDIAFGVAKKLLDAMFKRSSLHLATVRQVGIMIRLGMDPGEARRTSFTDASKWIDAHKTW